MSAVFFLLLSHPFQRRFFIQTLERLAFLLRQNRLSMEGYVIEFALQLRNIYPVFKKRLHKIDPANAPRHRLVQQAEIKIVIVKAFICLLYTS